MNDFVNNNLQNVFKLSPNSDVRKVNEEFELKLPTGWVYEDLGGISIYRNDSGELMAWCDYENAEGYIKPA